MPPLDHLLHDKGSPVHHLITICVSLALSLSNSPPQHSPTTATMMICRNLHAYRAPRGEAIMHSTATTAAAAVAIGAAILIVLRQRRTHDGSTQSHIAYIHSHIAHTQKRLNADHQELTISAGDGLALQAVSGGCLEIDAG